MVNLGKVLIFFINLHTQKGDKPSTKKWQVKKLLSNNDTKFVS